MSEERLATDAELSDLNQRLKGGIETCRSVIANYRSLLTNDEPLDLATTNDGSAEEGPA